MGRFQQQNNQTAVKILLCSAFCLLEPLPRKPAGHLPGSPSTRQPDPSAADPSTSLFTLLSECKQRHRGPRRRVGGWRDGGGDGACFEEILGCCLGFYQLWTHSCECCLGSQRTSCCDDVRETIARTLGFTTPCWFKLGVNVGCSSKHWGV